MEIQIPVADQDTATESQPTDRTLTDRTGHQTLSDNWSREGNLSNVPLTSRSHATSVASQPALHSMAENDETDHGAIEENEESGVDDSFCDTQRAVYGDTDSLTNPSGGDESTTEDPNKKEDSYRSTFCAAEEVADKDLATHRGELGKHAEMATPEVSNREPPDMEQKEQTLEPREETEMATPKLSDGEPPDVEQKEKTPEPEEEITGSNNPDLQETVDIIDQTQKDGFINSSVELGHKPSEADSLGDAGDLETSKKTQNGNEDQDAGENTTDLELGRDKKEKVFLTENNNPEEEGSDISDVRAETPDWAEEEEEKEEVSVLEGEVRQKLGCSSINSPTRPLTRSSLHDDIAPGQRAVVNTPASYYTTTDINADLIRNIESRNTSHAGVETSREAAFQRAMTLMTSRCESKQGAGGEEDARLFDLNDDTYGYKSPKYFYVQQRKPSPMAPLKVWRGYHGNVYFEPIQIKKVGNGEGETRSSPRSSLSLKSSGSKHRTLTATTRSHVVVPVNSIADKDSTTMGDGRPPTRSTTRLNIKRGPTSAKSGTSSRSVAAISQHHVLYLDKQVVTHPNNSAMHEELQVMEKQQSTGSLNVQQRSHFPQDLRTGGGGVKGKTERSCSGASSAKFDRICKGSVVYNLRRAKSGGVLGNSMKRGSRFQGREYPAGKSIQSTDLMVVGDKFAASSLMSPLLRTQTQFSLSSQRMTMNSPDLYGAFDHLPPLEQVRISLRHMDTHGDSAFTNRVSSPYTTGTNVGVVEELKPFIKYSPDVKAQYNRQIKYY